MKATLWIEKYRPQTFADIKGQDHIVSKIAAFLEAQNMPHLLFVGPAGVGKSSLSLVIGRQLFGDHLRENFLELNASDERGIDVVRVKVKDFARTRAIGHFPFKIIFLDECDALTKEAQQALRRTMETYAPTTRFILSANYSSKIIDPIQSRCALFKFRPLEKDHVKTIIDGIAVKESLKIADGAVDALYQVSHGDCRRLENILQSCAAVGDTVSPELVYELASVAKPQEVGEVLKLALAMDFVKARNLLLDVMLKYGLAGSDVIKQIQSEIWNLPIDAQKKIRLTERCGDVEFRMVEGSDEFLQLEALLASFGAVGKN